jgi:hypothetical protein
MLLVCGAGLEMRNGCAATHASVVRQDQRLSCAYGARATFLCVARETWPKERPPRFRASQASCLRGSRSGCGVCRQSIHGLTPNWFASMRTTLRADPPPARRCRGAPGRAAGHRGPHSSERPEQSQGNSRKHLRTAPPCTDVIFNEGVANPAARFHWSTRRFPSCPGTLRAPTRRFGTPTGTWSTSTKRFGTSAGMC